MEIEKLAKIFWVDPELIFVKGLPFGPLYHPKEYGDRTSIGLVHYLEILPSIALYGFKYVVTVDRALKVIDGDYRVFAARELGIKLPIVFQPYHDKFLWKAGFHILSKIRRILKRQSLLYKTIKNPDFKYGNVLLTCKFQKNILFDQALLQQKLKVDKQGSIRRINEQARKRKLFYILIHKFL